MDLIAYALAVPDGEEFTGGVIGTAEGDLHLRDTLREGDGKHLVFLATDNEAIGRLDQLGHAFQRVDVEDVPESVDITWPYDRMDEEALAALVQTRDLSARSGSPAQLARALKDADLRELKEAQAAAEQALAAPDSVTPVVITHPPTDGQTAAGGHDTLGDGAGQEG